MMLRVCRSSGVIHALQNSVCKFHMIYRKSALLRPMSLYNCGWSQKSDGNAHASYPYSVLLELQGRKMVFKSYIIQLWFTVM